MLTRESNVLFVTFSLWSKGQRMPTNGNLEPLRDYLIPRVKRLILIDQMHPGSEGVMPKIEEYEGNNFKSYNSAIWMYMLWPLLKLTNKQGTQSIFKVRDFLSVFDWAIRDRIKFNYFIGLECINTFAGIWLRKFGRVEKVVYYVLDYSPTRYPPGWFKKLYLALDRWCAINSDYIWDVSKAMQPARISSGLDSKQSAPVIHVPIGLYPYQIKLADTKKIVPYSLAYMGTLGKDNGPDLAIEAMPLIAKKYPQVTLKIVGGGEDNLRRLEALAKKLKVEARINFYGFVVDSAKMSEIIRRCYVALAPYRAIPNSVRYFADASKLRAYAAAGLPIITTPVPPLGREFQQFGGAIIVPDDPESLAKAVVALFSDPKRYARMRERVFKFAKNNTWNNEFDKAFAQSK